MDSYFRVYTDWYITSLFKTKAKPWRVRSASYLCPAGKCWIRRSSSVIATMRNISAQGAQSRWTGLENHSTRRKSLVAQGKINHKSSDTSLQQHQAEQDSYPSYSSSNTQMSTPSNKLNSATDRIPCSFTLDHHTCWHICCVVVLTAVNNHCSKDTSFLF
jgi:hypothetical protein